MQGAPQENFRRQEPRQFFVLSFEVQCNLVNGHKATDNLGEQLVQGPDDHAFSRIMGRDITFQKMLLVKGADEVPDDHQ